VSARSHEFRCRSRTFYNFFFSSFVTLFKIFFIFYLLIRTGIDETAGKQTLIEKVEGSDSYSALLWGTMGATVLTLLFYFVQPVKNGALVVPTPDVLMQMFSCAKEPNLEDMDQAEIDALPPKARPLMSVRDSVEAFLFGMARIFPALIVLTLAWASGEIMVQVGCDRLFSGWIVGGIAPELLPTLSFLISLFMALATGTSWGTMSILFPLILVPTYIASDGDEEIFYATVAGVLSGAVAGDHMSPISDTTVLTALACNCELLGHVYTQAPYVLMTCFLCTIVGTLPIGYNLFPNIIGILLGLVATIAWVYLYCKPVISPTGKYDFFTELIFRLTKATKMTKLAEDTVRAYNGEDLSNSAAAVEGLEVQKMLEDGDDEEPSKVKSAAPDESSEEVAGDDLAKADTQEEICA
jgi:Na+/H+ antiporter NhaC